MRGLYEEVQDVTTNTKTWSACSSCMQRVCAFQSWMTLDREECCKCVSVRHVACLLGRHTTEAHRKGLLVCVHPVGYHTSQCVQPCVALTPRTHAHAAVLEFFSFPASFDFFAHSFSFHTHGFPNFEGVQRGRRTRSPSTRTRRVHTQADRTHARGDVIQKRR